MTTLKELKQELVQDQELYTLFTEGLNNPTVQEDDAKLVQKVIIHRWITSAIWNLLLLPPTSIKEPESSA